MFLNFFCPSNKAGWACLLPLPSAFCKFQCDSVKLLPISYVRCSMFELFQFTFICNLESFSFAKWRSVNLSTTFLVLFIPILKILLLRPKCPAESPDENSSGRSLWKVFLNFFCPSPSPSPYPSYRFLKYYSSGRNVRRNLRTKTPQAEASGKCSLIFFAPPPSPSPSYRFLKYYSSSRNLRQNLRTKAPQAESSGKCSLIFLPLPLPSPSNKAGWAFTANCSVLINTCVVLNQYMYSRNKDMYDNTYIRTILETQHMYCVTIHILCYKSSILCYKSSV